MTKVRKAARDTKTNTNISNIYSQFLLKYIKFQCFVTHTAVPLWFPYKILWFSNKNRASSKITDSGVARNFN